MFYAFMIALGLMFGAGTQGFGPEKLCNVMDGKYDGVVVVGHGGKEATPGAKVPYCTAGPSTLVEKVIAN